MHPFYYHPCKGGVSTTCKMVQDENWRVHNSIFGGKTAYSCCEFFDSLGHSYNNFEFGLTCNQ